MALSDAAIKNRFKNRIHEGLRRNFIQQVGKGKGYPPIADPFWALLADAISDIAMDLVDELKTNAEVKVGIHVTGTATPSGDTVNASTDTVGHIE